MSYKAPKYALFKVISAQYYFTSNTLLFASIMNYL